MRVCGISHLVTWILIASTPRAFAALDSQTQTRLLQEIRAVESRQGTSGPSLKEIINKLHAEVTNLSRRVTELYKEGHKKLESQTHTLAAMEGAEAAWKKADDNPYKDTQWLKEVRDSIAKQCCQASAHKRYARRIIRRMEKKAHRRGNKRKRFKSNDL
ncbi:MAG: hypothetical protein AB7G93_02050 [Bdellovibrionales bacterium]